MKVYLDTCIISALAKGDASTEETEALMQILRLRPEGKVELITSDEAKQEIDQIPGAHRIPHEAIFSLLEQLPMVPVRSGSRLTLMGAGGPGEDSRFTKLKQLLPQESDARHIFQALANGVPCVLTFDRATILRYDSQLKAEFGIEVTTPQAFLANLGL